MDGHEHTEHPADDLFEVERSTHVVDPESELGRAMALAREDWGEAGAPVPDDIDENAL